MNNTRIYADFVKERMMPYLTHPNQDIVQKAQFVESYALRWDKAVRDGNDAHAAYLLAKYEMWCDKLGCDPLA